MGDVTPETLGSYEVKRLLGRGGMGEVYLAHDSRLGRDVALKLLPAGLAKEPTLRERFLREARAVAALNHPGIATIHEIGEADGRDFLALEYVEGGGFDALPADRKPSSAELIDWALAIAEALEYAHSKGVVHRDLKPANVMLSGIGRPKLLDFGLAKLLHEPADENGDAALLTQEGDVLGTPAFMSPEQARGQPIDSRTDVFSFGSLLYRLAAGTEPFGGRTALETLDSVVHQDPRPLAQLRPDLPDGLLAVVEKSMRKPLGERYQHMSDVVADLRHLKRTSESVAALASVSAAGWPRRLPWILAGLALVIAIVFVRNPFGGSRSSEPRFALDAPRRVTFETGLELGPSISPDGTQVAYSAVTENRARIHIRSVDGGSPRPLTGDADAFEFQPRYSPSGESILFLTREGAFRAPALGGRTIPVALESSGSGSAADLSRPIAAAWSPDGKRVFVSRRSGECSIVSIDGGEEVRLRAARAPSETDWTSNLHSSSWSPTGEWIACTAGNSYAAVPGPYFGNAAPTAIVLLRASDGELRTITDRVTTNQSPVWSPDGRHLLFLSNRQGPFDIYSVEIAADGSVVGDPARVSTGLQARSIALSADGKHLVYETYWARANLLSLPIPEGTEPVDASAAQPLTSANQGIETIAVSPDGRYVVYDSNLTGNWDIYRIPVEGGVAEQLTDHPADDFAGSLSPDGEELAYHSFRTGTREVFVQPLRGGSPQQITDSPGTKRYPVWSSVAGHLAYLGAGPDSGGVCLVTRRADGSWSEPALIRAGAGRIDWLPDGQRIACVWRSPTWPRVRRIEVLAVDSREYRVVYEPTPPDDPEPREVRSSDDGRSIFFKSWDETGRISIWSVPIDGGRPKLRLRFTDDVRTSTRAEFDVGAGRFFFTTEERESEVWVADFVR